MVDKPARVNYVALAIGAILAVWGAETIDERLAFIESSVAVQGTVVRLTHGAHHPLIEFVTISGERVSFPGSFVTVGFGDTVPVRYDPGQAASQRNSRHVHEHVARVDHLDRVHDGVSLRRLEGKVASAETGGRRRVVRHASRRCLPSTRMRQTQKSLRLGGFICTIKDSW